MKKSAVVERRKLLFAGLALAAVVGSGLSGARADEPAATAGESPALPQTSKPMRLAVIGAGSLGGTVGRLWVQAGHEVMFSSRHPDELDAMTRELGPRASAGTPQQAADFGTVVLISVPYEALPAVGRDLEKSLRGKIVLDACNPSAASDDPLAQEAAKDGIGKMSAKYLPGTRVVRAFSAVDATEIADSATRKSGKLGIPLAGDDAKAIQVAAQLVRDAGSEPVVVGDLAAARSFQRGSAGYRANTTAPELRRLLGLPKR